MSVNEAKLMDDKAALVGALATLTKQWAETAAEMAEMANKIESANRDRDYWLKSSQKHEARAKELELRVKELESPLASLARAAGGG